MRYLLVIVVSAILFPSQVIATGGIDLSDIEIKILARDMAGARNELKTSGLNRTIKNEVEDVITYMEKYLTFADTAEKKGEETNAIAQYQYVLQAYNDLPDNLHFSSNFVTLTNDTIKRARAFVDNQCGKDYGQIRVGMKLSRVQKCVGPFTLRGQVKGKNGILDHYTRGGSYIYTKNGQVVAWGE